MRFELTYPRLYELLFYDGDCEGFSDSYNVYNVFVNED